MISGKASASATAAHGGAGAPPPLPSSSTTLPAALLPFPPTLPVAAHAGTQVSPSARGEEAAEEMEGEDNTPVILLYRRSRTEDAIRAYHDAAGDSPDVADEAVALETEGILEAKQKTDQLEMPLGQLGAQ